jgi:hypothetical protein
MSHSGLPMIVVEGDNFFLGHYCSFLPVPQWTNGYSNILLSSHTCDPHVVVVVVVVVDIDADGGMMLLMMTNATMKARQRIEWGGGKADL